MGYSSPWMKGRSKGEKVKVLLQSYSILENGDEMLSWSHGDREMEFPLQDRVHCFFVFIVCLTD